MDNTELVKKEARINEYLDLKFFEPNKNLAQ